MYIRLYTLIALLAAAPCVGAATPLALSVDDAAAFALKNNPSLAAARLRIEEARGRLHQSGRLSNPEIELEFSRMTTGREGSLGTVLTQRFPITSRLRQEKAVSRAELAAAEAEVREAERKLAGEVRGAAVKLLAFGGQRELRAKQLANSRQLAAFLVKRVEAGEASSVDSMQVDLESRLIEVENLQLDAEEAVIKGELRPLLGISGSRPFNISGSLPLPGRTPSAANNAARPDIQAAQARVDAAHFGVLEQRAKRWEDLSVGAAYTRERSLDRPDPIETQHVLGLRLSLPLPIWNTNAGLIRQSQAAAARAEKELSATKLAASAEVSSARASMDAYAQMIATLDGHLLPTAIQIEDQLNASYLNGQGALADVLRARTRRLEIQRQRLDALRDYQLAHVRHQAAIGSRSK